MADDTALDLAEQAYQAYRAWSPDRSLPLWDAVPLDVKRSWRLLAFGYRPVEALELPPDPTVRPVPTSRRDRMPVLQVVSEPVRERPVFLYFVRAATGHIKIGISSDPTKRYNSLQTSSPVPLDLLGVVHCVDARAEEARLHEHFAHLRVQGEWFKPGDDLMEFIGSLGFPPPLPYRDPITI